MVDIVRCVLVFAEDARHVREIVTAPFGIGSGHLGLAVFSHVLNIVRRRAALGKELDDLRCGRQRFVPFAVVEAGVIDVVPVAVCIPGLVRVHWVLLLHAAERKLDPLLRRAVVFFQEFHIAVHQIHLVRDPHGGIAPAHAVLTDVSVTGRPGQRHSGVLCLHCFQFFRIVEHCMGHLMYNSRCLLHLAHAIPQDDPFLPGTEISIQIWWKLFSRNGNRADLLHCLYKILILLNIAMEVMYNGRDRFSLCL